MAKAYRGVLKARINKIYGGDVTIDKCKKLKARPNATPRDKQLCNWFINMQTNKLKIMYQRESQARMVVAVDTKALRLEKVVEKEIKNIKK